MCFHGKTLEILEEGRYSKTMAILAYKRAFLLLMHAVRQEVVVLAGVCFYSATPYSSGNISEGSFGRGSWGDFFLLGRFLLTTGKEVEKGERNEMFLIAKE